MSIRNEFNSLFTYVMSNVILDERVVLGKLLGFGISHCEESVRFIQQLEQCGFSEKNPCFLWKLTIFILGNEILRHHSERFVAFMTTFYPNYYPTNGPNLWQDDATRMIASGLKPESIESYLSKSSSKEKVKVAESSETLDPKIHVVESQSSETLGTKIKVVTDTVSKANKTTSVVDGEYSKDERKTWNAIIEFLQDMCTSYTWCTIIRNFGLPNSLNDDRVEEKVRRLEDAMSKLPKRQALLQLKKCFGGYCGINNDIDNYLKRFA